MKIDDERAGELVLPASVPRLSETPAEFRHAGRALGADNQRLYGDLLDLVPEEIAALLKENII